MTTSPPRTLGWKRALLILLSLFIVVLAIAIYETHKDTSTNARDAVATWNPNHAQYCTASIGLQSLTQQSLHRPATVAAELQYYERFAVHAPTRLLHTQISAMAIAFANLTKDPSGLRLVSKEEEFPPPTRPTSDPVVRAFYKTLTPFDRAPLNHAVNTCGLIAPGTSDNAEAAQGQAANAYFLNIARGYTGTATIAQYEARAALALGESVTADGPFAKFTFQSGPPACVTLPPASGLMPALVACPTKNQT